MAILARPSLTGAVAALAAILACSPTAPAQASEDARMEPVWIRTAAPNGQPSQAAVALLSLPLGWTTGDAAALVLSEGPWPHEARETLVVALLAQQAAVLEFDLTVAGSLGAEAPRTGPAPIVAELALDVSAAAQMLRRDTGAGLVVALGHGAAGEAAMLAASLEQKAMRADDAGLVAAAASLGPGPARFVLGGAEPGRGWPVRAELLCGILAAATAAATPPARTRAEAECRRALIGPDHTSFVRLAAP